MLEGSNGFMISGIRIYIGYSGTRLKVPDRENTLIDACRAPPSRGKLQRIFEVMVYVVKVIVRVCGHRVM